jgi:glycosyltransferase involved in cell wall biosynthesis
VRICLISSVHPWVNPRLVKEADLLASLGHEVSVVTKRVDQWSDERDAPLLATKRWPTDRINLLRHDPAGRWRWLAAAVRSKAAFAGYRLSGALWLAEEGYYRGFAGALQAALRTRADLFIAHTQGALPIAARAARKTGAKYAFDCEDLLAEETADGLTDPVLRRAILDIERAYLPKAAYVTATSIAMAAHLSRSYAITPRVVRNVFPLAELSGMKRPAARPHGRTTELVWISATLGARRGLEDAVHALAKLPDTARLTMFGRMLPAFEPAFLSLIDHLGVAARITIEQAIPDPSLVLSAVSRFDVGLSLDLNDSLNRSLTICNKVFFYLQAGLLLAATDTSGQREIVDSVPHAGFLYPPGDADALAARLQPFVADRRRLTEAQEAAWQAGQDRYNWDRERDVFLDAVREALPLTRLAAAAAVAS